MITQDQVDLFMKKAAEKGIVLTLEPLRNICGILGEPQNRVPCVHIAGTNGKGSILGMVSTCLEEAGLKVGRFFSPAVFSDEPTVTVNGSPIDRLIYLSVMEEIITACERMESYDIETPTAFELEALCALCCFARSGCDIAVVECGMGGRDDATNIIDSNEVCVFSSVGLDHTAQLGTTVTEIAKNKSGILRQGCTAVCALQDYSEASDVIAERAAALGCSLVLCDKAENIAADGLDGQRFTYKGREYVIPLCGEHQTRNAAAAIETINALREKGFRITDDAVFRGLKRVSWNGRFQCISRKPTVILDGAHNVPAALALAKTLDDCLPNKKPVLLFGILADKDWEKVAGILAPKAERVITFAPPNPRALSSRTLAETCGKYAPSQSCDSIGEAVKAALEGLSEDGVIVAAGSLYSLDELKKAFAENGVFLEKPKKSGELTLTNKIVKNLVYIMKMAEIRRLEQNRSFCRHDIRHCMDVARLTMMICAEEHIEANADTVYAAALLHDIGRADEYSGGLPHDIAGIETAAKILVQVECPPELSREIIRLIAGHRKDDGKKTPLESAFYRADKQSRLCFACAAADECCWDDSKKNLKITR